MQSWMQGGLVSGLVQFWEKNTPETFSVLISDEFFLPFSELMEREIFTKKRHEKKVTFSDAKKTREILFNGGLLHLLLR